MNLKEKKYLLLDLDGVCYGKHNNYSFRACIWSSFKEDDSNLYLKNLKLIKIKLKNYKQIISINIIHH